MQSPLGNAYATVLQRREEAATQHPDDVERLAAAFGALTKREVQLLVCALAGNHPESLANLRMPVLRALAKQAR